MKQHEKGIAIAFISIIPVIFHLDVYIILGVAFLCFVTSMWLIITCKDCEGEVVKDGV